VTDLVVVRNVAREGPGLLADVLDDEGVSFDIVDADDVDNSSALPPVGHHRAVVVLGGPASANDDTATMRAEVEWVRAVVDAGVPYLGVCLGLQVLVRAAGGRVVRNPVAEVGWRAPDGEPWTVALTDAGRADPLLAGVPDEFAVFQLHGETVEPTPEMAVLATGRHCRDQIVRAAPHAYGIQAHVECTPQMLAVWADEDPALAPLDRESLLRSADAFTASYREHGWTLLRNFLQIAGLVP
jgi:GMP synthase (glutamine-hydrolysing)